MHQGGVEQADVVWCNDRLLAGFGEMFEAFDLEAEKCPEQEGGDVLDAVGAPGAQDEHDGCKVHNAETGIEQRQRNFEVLQGRDGEARECHAGGGDDITTRDDAGAAINRRPSLHGGERRHDEQAARKSDASEINEHPHAGERGEDAAG